MNHDNEEMTPFWVALAEARNRPEVIEKEGRRHPWESSDPQVKTAWEALTDPRNLTGLERWGDDAGGMNSFAREVTVKAIEHCRVKARLVS
jgi:hypothetical protein